MSRLVLGSDSNFLLMILIFANGGRSSSDAGFAATPDSVVPATSRTRKSSSLQRDKIKIVSRSKNVQQKAPRGFHGKPFESKQRCDYGLGLEVVVVVLVEFDVVGAGTVVVVFVLVVSFVFSVVGFTMVVSVFFSAGELAGSTTVVSLCSQPPRSAALAKMHNSFFIGLIGCPSVDKG